MLSRAATVLTTLVLCLAVLVMTPAAASLPDRDCGDFGTQAEAQRFYLNPSADPHRLDADDDGVACESNPCPCTTGGGGGGGGGDEPVP